MVIIFTRDCVFSVGKRDAESLPERMAHCRKSRGVHFRSLVLPSAAIDISHGFMLLVYSRVLHGADYHAFF